MGVGFFIASGTIRLSFAGRTKRRAQSYSGLDFSCYGAFETSILEDQFAKMFENCIAGSGLKCQTAPDSGGTKSSLYIIVHLMPFSSVSLTG